MERLIQLATDLLYPASSVARMDQRRINSKTVCTIYDRCTTNGAINQRLVPFRLYKSLAINTSGVQIKSTYFYEAKLRVTFELKLKSRETKSFLNNFQLQNYNMQFINELHLGFILLNTKLTSCYDIYKISQNKNYFNPHQTLKS